MLKGISPLISPELLKILAEMGHGDEIVLADAHFPGHTLGPRCLRADGIRIAPLLHGILPLFELDSYVESPCIMMAPVAGDQLDAELVQAYQAAIAPYRTSTKAAITHVERFAFYERAKCASAIVITGETAKYGNIILKKGVTPFSA